MTLLVTGAGGFIGSRLRSLTARLETSTDVAWIDSRWEDSSELHQLAPSRVDRCIHLGWDVAIPDYRTNETTNQRSLRSSMELLDLLQRRGCEHLVAVGTYAEYAPSDRPLDEDAPCVGGTAYADAKLAFHSLLERSELPFAWARPFNVLGAGPPAHHLVAQICTGLRNRKVVLLSEGTQVRDFIDVLDVARPLADCRR